MTSGAGSAGEPVGTATLPPPRTSANTGEWSRGQTWPGVVSGAPARPELPAAPLRLEAVPYAGVSEETAGPAREAGSAGAASTSTAPVNLELVGGDTVVDSPVTGVGGGSAVGPGTVDPAVTARPRATAAPADGGSDVIYPTGVIVAAEEHPLYQRSSDQGGEASEVYLSLPEPELAEDGTEHQMVPYYSSVGAFLGTP